MEGLDNNWRCSDYILRLLFLLFYSRHYKVLRITFIEAIFDFLPVGDQFLVHGWVHMTVLTRIFWKLFPTLFNAMLGAL